MSEEDMKKKDNLEHEVLDRLKLVTEMDFNKEILDDSYIDAVLKARNIILDLYTKEKEKNGKAIGMLKEEIKHCENENAEMYDKCHIQLKFNKHLLDILEEE